MSALDKICTTAKEMCRDLRNLRPGRCIGLEKVGLPASSVPSLIVTLKRRLESEGDLCVISSAVSPSVISEVEDGAGEIGSLCRASVDSVADHIDGDFGRIAVSDTDRHDERHLNH